MGSQSVVSTVGHAITLHSLGALPFLLLVLWALSPLGGQSALRLIYETNHTMSETRPVFYANMDSTTDFEAQSYNKDAVNRVNAVLSSSLMTSDTLEYSHMDTWNHPKIPRIDTLETADASNSSNWQWYDIDENQVNQTYASLTGLNVVNLKDRASANFTVPYQYLYYNCTLSPRTNASNSVPVNNYLVELSNEGKLDGWGAPLNTSSWAQFMDRGFFLWGILSNSTVLTPEKLLYGSEFFSGSLYLFECSMNSVAVEANIVCQSSDCRTTRVRRLKSPRPQTGLGTTYAAAHSYHTFDRVLRHFVAIGGSDPYDGDSKNRNPVDEFVYGVTPWSRDVVTGLGQLLNWTNYIVDPSLSTGMSQRLTKVMNTYWDASRWQVAPTRNDPFGKISINTTSGVPYTSLTMNKTDAFVTWPVPIYKINRPWVATLIMCCCVLFLIGLAGLVLALQATVPDIFNYVSSLTRDNPYMNVPKGGTFLDGAERASLLRDLPVQLGDVTPMEEVGYLAMQTVDNKQRAEQSRVRKGRVYS